MRITLDHNCIIDLERRTEMGRLIEAIIASSGNQCFVVNIGASEMREKGVRPEHYEKFEELLSAARVELLPRLNPMGIYGVTFWDKCVWGSDEGNQLIQDIAAVLFGDQSLMDLVTEDIDSPIGRKWLNRICDVHTMWCHIHNGNDIFLTTDKNFKKETKLQKLISLGAVRICNPKEMQPL